MLQRFISLDASINEFLCLLLYVQVCITVIAYDFLPIL